MIPRQIVQTSPKKLPSSIVRRTMRTVGDDFSYRHYDDAAILEFFSDHPLPGVEKVSERFLSLRSGEHKADLFRYYYLYVCGGVYFDTDVLLVSNLDCYITENSLVSVLAGNVGGALFQGFLATSPGHPVMLRAVRDVCEISDQQLAADHHVLCKNLKVFVDQYVQQDNAARGSTLLLKEVPHNRNVAKSIDFSEKTVLYHFWKRPYPPRFPIGLRDAIWAF